MSILETIELVALRARTRLRTAGDLEAEKAMAAFADELNIMATEIKRREQGWAK